MKNYRIVFFILSVIICSIFYGCKGTKNTEVDNPFVVLEYSKNDTADSSPAWFILDAKVEMPTEDINANYDSLRYNMIADIFGERYVGEDDDELLRVYADSVYSESCVPEVIEFDGSYKPRYEEFIETEIVLYDDSLLCLRRNLYIDHGGAHGLLTVRNYVYKLPEGHPVHEDEIFNAGYVHAISTLLVKEADKLRKDSILPEKDEWFNDDNIVPNGNFSVSADGMTYHYNPYEIAPYVFGNIEIKLDKRDILPFLNKRSVVYEYLMR